MRRASDQARRTGQEIARGLDGATVASGRMRSGMQQLSFQIGDIAQQFAMGTRPMQIFAQQSGQVIQAFQVMGGEGNKFLRFLSGPWGVALTAATVVLSPWIAKLLESRTELQKATDELAANERKADLARRAQEAFGNTLPGVTRKIREETQALRDHNRTLEENQQRTLGAAQANQDELERQLTENVRAQAAARQRIINLERNAGRNASGQIIESAELRRARDQLRQLIATNAEIQRQAALARDQITEAQIPILQRDVESSMDGAAAATREYERALASLNRQLRLNQIGEADYRRELTRITTERDRATEAARRENQVNRDLVRPATGAVLSQFGADRSGVPINGRRVAGRRHQGVDIRGNVGDPVIAPSGGTAYVRNAPGGLGLYVEIRADSGARDLLAHLSAANIQSGQRVEAGQLVGLIGTSGNARGGTPHLHWQRMMNGQWVDPMQRVGSSGAAQAARDAMRRTGELESFMSPWTQGRSIAEMEQDAEALNSSLGDTAGMLDHIASLPLPDLGNMLTIEDQQQIESFLQSFNEDLTSGLAQAIVYGKDLGDALIATFQRAAAALIESGLMQILTGQGPPGGILGGLLGGGRGILGGLFGGGGGFNTSGLLDAAAALAPGAFASGGSFTIGGRSGIDRNVLSLNGTPVARVSQGETVGVSPAGAGRETVLRIMPSADFEVKVEQVAAGVVIRSAPMIKADTMRSITEQGRRR